MSAARVQSPAPVDLLMLNWRYVDHPQSGGAEVLTHAILTRLVAAGHRVTCFTAAYPGAPATSTLDGVRLVRRGAQWTVHVHAWRWLRGRTGEFRSEEHTSELQSRQYL